MKATKSIKDAKGVVWTIFHCPGTHIQDLHIGRSTLGHYNSFCTRSGALKWLKREAARAEKTA